MKRPDISKLNHYRSIFFKIGLVCSLSIVILAFNYTVYESTPIVKIVEIDDFNEDIPVRRTKHLEKAIPPPPRHDISEVVLEEDDPEFVEEKKPEIIPLEIVENKEIPTNNNKKTKPISPPTPKPPIVLPEEPKEKDLVDKEIWTIVEYMPEFGDCNLAKNKAERKAISDKNLLTYIYKNIKYPTIARENGVEGPVVVRFIIDENGRVIEPEILRDPGAGCGQEVLRIISKMPNWKPGKQGENFVKVQYNLPVKFHLK